MPWPNVGCIWDQSWGSGHGAASLPPQLWLHRHIVELKGRTERVQARGLSACFGEQEIRKGKPPPVVSESWEERVVLTEVGWRARNVSSDQRESGVWLPWRRATLPHDYTEHASRASFSKVTTCMASQLYAWWIIVPHDGPELLFNIDNSSKILYVSDIKILLLIRKIWHLIE